MSVAALYHLQSELQFMREVERLATLFGWRYYHTHRSTGSPSGFPDLVLIRRPRVIVAELKAERGKATQAQLDWLDAFRECGIESYLWRPSAWETITEVLR